MPETYPTGGAKNFIHGIDYQKLWLMLFFRRAVNRKYFFRLATEMSSAAGFDDIVFRYEQNGTTVCMLIQVKHKQDGSKKICVGDLLTKSGELNLVKHFAAFLEIQGNEEFKDKMKDFFIITNVDFDHESLASKGITVEKIDTQDEFLNIGDSAKYKLGGLHNNIAQYLKQGMSAGGRKVSNEKIKGFLNELVFVVNLPNDVELERLIKDEISDDLAKRFKYFGDNDSVLNALSTMISNWMKDKRGRFLTPEEGKEFFQKVELWDSTVSEIRQGVERIEGKVDEIGEVLNNQQARKEPVWFNMKYPVKTFTGRRSELQKIYKELHKTTNEQAEVSQIVVISGLGGIGKSELARKYAYEYRKDYDGNVIWISAETQKDLEGSFRGLAEGLKKRLTEGSKISITEEGIKSTIKDVYRYFRNVESLFIFDNAKGYRDVNKFLPLSFPDCKKPYVLITSHDTKWEVEGVEYEEGRIEVIRLGVLDETEAWEFVKKALDIKDNLQDEKIRELTEELQYLPLALGQAVVYIYNKNEELAPYEKFEISDYLKKYKQQAEKLFEETESLLKKWLYDEEEENEGEYSKRVRYTKTILTTWNVTIDAIKQKECGPEALDILEVMVYLAPDRIRVKEIFLKLIYDKAKLCNIFGLLSEYPVIDLKEKEASVYIPAELKLQIEEIFLKLLVNSEKRMWEAVKLLNRYSMIDLEGGVANIHRLVQKVTELKLKKEGREEDVLRKTIKLINADYIFDDSIVASVWGYASKYDELIDNFYFNFTYGIQKCTPLHSLAKSGDYEAVKRILTRIEDAHLGRLNCIVNAKNKDCITPLHSAACGGKLDILKYLISKGADINSGDRTLLHSAVLGQNLRIVEYLINKGADVNAKDERGFTPLYLSALCKGYDITEHLIEKGADVNAKNNGGNTSLHLATIMRNFDTARVLLKHNADVNAKNNEGKTALDYATNNNHQELVELLLAHGAFREY